MNRDTYNRVRNWFDRLDEHTKTLINQQLEQYPPCDDLTLESSKILNEYIINLFIYLADGPNWAWIMLNLLPIEQILQYTALASRSYRIRLQMINDAIEFSI